MFQYVPWKCWKGNCCLSAHRGFVLIVLYIKRERIFFEDSSKQKTFGFSTFDFSIKFIKSVASLRCDFMILILVVAMYLYQQQKKEILSLRPSFFWKQILIISAHVGSRLIFFPSVVGNFLLILSVVSNIFRPLSLVG